MKDCYNVSTIKRGEDDEMDKEIYEAKFKKPSPQISEETPDVLKKDDVISVLAKKMLDIRLDEEKEVFEKLLEKDEEHPEPKEELPKEDAE